MNRLLQFLRRAWYDPVGSKVISVGIVAVIASIYAAVVSLWKNISFASALEFLNRTTVTLNLSTLIIIVILVIFSFLYQGKIWPFTTKKIADNSSENLLKPKIELRESSPQISEPDHVELMQKEILKMVKASNQPTTIDTADDLLDADPDEFRFYAINKVRNMKGDELNTHLSRFLQGKWQLNTRKHKDQQSYSIGIHKISSEILLRRNSDAKDNTHDIQMRQIDFDSKDLILKYTLYRPYDKTTLGRETLNIHTDDHMTGVNETNGYVVTYRRQGLFKAIT